MSSATSALSTSRWEIDPNEISYDQKIGSGGFGVVWLGRWRNTAVVIKRLQPRDDIDSSELQTEFRREVGVLERLRPHPNVVQYLGVCTIYPHLGIITEYVEYGDLLKLSRARPPMSLNAKVSFFIGIAAGMHHLHMEGIVHCDLAARNVLVSRRGRDMAPKITDFGLSKIGTQYQSSSGFGPVRWMAPEALVQRLFSQRSDVWSFGILMWEILTDGCEPYDHIRDAIQVGMSVAQGMTLDVPKGTPPPIARIFRSCLAFEAHDRPSFANLCAQLLEVQNAIADQMVGDIFGDKSPRSNPLSPDGRRRDSGGKWSAVEKSSDEGTDNRPRLETMSSDEHSYQSFLSLDDALAGDGVHSGSVGAYATFRNNAPMKTSDENEPDPPLPPAPPTGILIPNDISLEVHISRETSPAPALDKPVVYSPLMTQPKVAELNGVDLSTSLKGNLNPKTPDSPTQNYMVRHRETEPGTSYSALSPSKPLLTRQSATYAPGLKLDMLPVRILAIIFCRYLSPSDLWYSMRGSNRALRTVALQSMQSASVPKMLRAVGGTSDGKKISATIRSEQAALTCILRVCPNITSIDVGVALSAEPPRHLQKLPPNLTSLRAELFSISALSTVPTSRIQCLEILGAPSLGDAALSILTAACPLLETFKLFAAPTITRSGLMQHLPLKLATLSLGNIGKDGRAVTDNLFASRTKLQVLVIGSAPKLSKRLYGLLPPDLRTLDLSNAPDLSANALHELPPRLNELRIRCETPPKNAVHEDCVAALPTGLQRLWLHNFGPMTVKQIMRMPQGIKQLVLINSPNLTSTHMAQMPASISELHLIDCPMLTALQFPEKCEIQNLELTRCSIRSEMTLKFLPKSLQTLTINSCSQFILSEKSKVELTSSCPRIRLAEFINLGTTLGNDANSSPSDSLKLIYR